MNDIDPSSPDESHSSRQFILSTCTALGGFEDAVTVDGTLKRVYTVGDEALHCLKDLKRIIRADEQFTKEVLIELNILETDLIPIILLHSKQSTQVSERFILACTEIIVPLTWPIPRKPDEKDDDFDPNLLHNYRKLKLKLLEKGVFEAIVNVCIKALRIPHRERSTRDQSIIRLILYLWRNLTAIVDPKASTIASDEKTLLATLQERLLIRFHESNVLELLLTMASTTGTTDTTEWNMILLEIIYNLLEFANTKETFLADQNIKNQKKCNKESDELSSLLSTENNQKRLKTKHAPSRHNRFGGSYTLEGWDGTKHVSHQQSAGFADLEQLISLQKKNRAGQKRKQMDEVGTHNVYRDNTALLSLKRFSQSFMESCFNTFYGSILKDMQRQDKSIVERDYARFYFTQKWFLEYFSYEIASTNAARLEKEKQQKSIEENQLILPNRSKQSDEEPNRATNSAHQDPSTSPKATQVMQNDEMTTIDDQNVDTPSTTPQPTQLSKDDEENPGFDYDLIANMMDLKMFWECMKRIRTCLEDKLWFDVQVTADCLRQMLITLAAMNRSTEQEYRDVADYIQSNIYHEQSTLDIFPDLIRSYRNQSFGYIETMVQLIHVILKLLEQYCKKQKVHFVRKKRTVRKAKSNPPDGHDEAMNDSEDNDSQTEEDRELRIAYREHVFAFESFEKRFATYDFVRVSCVLLEQYHHLKPEVLHAITTVFHRIMVRRKAEHLFWKLPTLELFSRIIKDRALLPKSPALDQFIQFIRYVVRQFFKKAETYPLLFVETLFKIEPCRVEQPKKQESTQSSP
ncbi:timeless protein-domain-containing protein [Halteromyces radiatus]|uniref:timeless protein-domain-containing protein n=1 Tax=Halteromyces radiatus TaxID=101107 RepID=UPI00221FEAE6|nr:timeless protein-domain-containing protein [Halteromyces radiatus]KAI8085063.1 timeless protein-domain-containing protein [Halteromyces radiatus]